VLCLSSAIAAARRSRCWPGCERRGDGQGFWLCHKRLSEGRFHWWPSEPDQAAGDQAATDQNVRANVLAAHQLSVLFSIYNVDSCVIRI
jgi:hypothetical protein